MSSSPAFDEKKSFDDDVKSAPSSDNRNVAIAEVYNPNLKAAVAKTKLNGFSRRSFMVCIPSRVSCKASAHAN
jgi:hypothetical protein